MILYLIAPYTANVRSRKTAKPYEVREHNVSAIDPIIATMIQDGYNPIWPPAMVHRFASIIEECDAMSWCLSLLANCDAAVLCDHWRESQGCIIEERYAREIGKKIYTIDSWREISRR